MNILKKSLSIATAILCAAGMYCGTVSALDYDIDVVILGDANGDGEITSKDAEFITSLLANAGVSGKAVRVADYPGADVNDDGKITALDATLIKKFLANTSSDTLVDIAIELIGDASLTYVPEVSLSTIVGEPGETIAMSVNIAANNDCAAIDLIIGWDDAELTGSFADFCGQANGSAAEGEQCISVVAYTGSAICDGAVATIDFTIPEDAEDGDEYTISISQMNEFVTYANGDVTDNVVTTDSVIKVVTFPELSNSKLALNVGASKILSMENYDGEVTWSSDNNAVATVSSEGQVTAVSSGSTKIYAVTEDGSKYLCTVTVYDKGDANGDGKVSALDASTIAKLLAEASIAGDTVTVEDYPAADYNGDGKITAQDASEVAKYLAGKTI